MSRHRFAQEDIEFRLGTFFNTYHRSERLRLLTHKHLSGRAEWCLEDFVSFVSADGNVTQFFLDRLGEYLRYVANGSVGKFIDEIQKARWHLKGRKGSGETSGR